MDHISVLKDLSAFTGVSGREEGISKYIAELFKNYCDSVEIDKFYNVSGYKKGSAEAGKKIMIMAHHDEIGLMVKSIDENGFIKFTSIGGVDSKILLAQEVVVHGSEDIYGVIGAKPPHLLKPEETKKAAKMDDLYIDTGFNKESISKLVSIGDIITLKTYPFELKGNKLSSKCLDNRAGVGVLLDIMDRLSKLKHNDDIIFVATSQEELGLSGAKIAAYNINPDLAIVIDACHGEIPDASKDETYPLGKGPAIAIGPNLHRQNTKKIIDLAKEENIPYQIDVEPGNTGTEAWATQVSRSGIPTLLVSIPLKYMHTTIETIHINDIKNAGKLVSRFVSDSAL
ncbi:M42 family metallopeptidase [Acetivibrio cellulolyticus]|uniref:M42 family metallopeptidase n=1 Tax=Acetivibrio cellulolyticus TaxID=35830 RepID=UPI0001E301CD|nr:M42 family metallopeptidase [Acetivibrio cellulolyticus]